MSLLDLVSSTWKNPPHNEYDLHLHEMHAIGPINFIFLALSRAFSLSLSLSLSLHLLLSFSTTTAPKAPSRWTAARHLGERPDTGERRRVHIIHRSPYRCIPLSIRLSKNAYIYNAYVYTYVCGLERASSTATSTSSQADSSGSAGVYGRSAGPYSRSYF